MKFKELLNEQISLDKNSKEYKDAEAIAKKNWNKITNCKTSWDDLNNDEKYELTINFFKNRPNMKLKIVKI